MYDTSAPEFDYFITPRIESYLVQNALEIQAAQSNMTITGFDLTIKLPDGAILDFGEGLPNPYNITSNAVIPPSDAIGGISRGAAAAPVIPSTYRTAIIDALNASGFTSIVLDVRANGTTAGGFSQQSPPFPWPIEFCEGCLGVPCAAGEIGDGVGCFPGQDRWGYCDEIVPPDMP